MPDGKTTSCTAPSRAYIPALDDGCMDGAYRCVMTEDGWEAQPFPLIWTHYPGKNCFWDGNGAGTEIESPRGSSTPGVSTLKLCKAACRAIYPKCEGVLFSMSGRCYRKADLSVSDCTSDAEMDLYVLSPPSPPSPPPGLPSPQLPPCDSPWCNLSDQSALHIVKALQHRFETGGKPPYDDHLAKAGVLVRQFDRISSIDAGKPWLPCPGDHWCAGYRRQWVGHARFEHSYR